MMKIMDPRGFSVKKEITLAQRPSIEQLKAGKILLYNNTKADYGNYVELFPRIKENFEAVGIKNFVEVRRTIRGMTPDYLKEFADMLIAEDPVAIVIALSDVGVSPASTKLTIELEKRNIPTVLITASPGAELAKAVAYYQAGRLCLCKMDLYQGSTKEDVRGQVDLSFDKILEFLTASDDVLKETTNLDFALDEVVFESGLLEDLNEELETCTDADDTIYRYFIKHHLCDGLPIIPPTVEKYQAMLEYCPYDENFVLAKEIGPAGKNITVRDAAVNAVMAGCKPQYLPVIITALMAMSDPKYNYLQAVTTSHPGGDLVLISGPIAKELGISGGQGCLGPGHEANVTIGRTINLIAVNVCRSVPGVCDLDCLASQAEYSYCFAEVPELSPWQTINEERYDSETSTVMVLKAEPPHDIIDFLSPTGGDLLDTICGSATTLGSNNTFIPGPLIVVVTPDHARLLARDGYDKDRIREHIHTFAYHDEPLSRNRGLMPVRPAGFETKRPMPVTRSPEDVEVVVAGGRGGHSAVILPWALHSESVVRAISLPDGTRAKSIDDFKRGGNHV